MITMDFLTGINVRDGRNINFAYLICTGEKTMETRDSNSLKSYIGKRVRIIRTGVQGQKAQVLGEVTIGEPIIYHNEIEFTNDYKKHLVTKDNGFYIKENGIKYGYPIIEPTLYEISYDAIGTGIISRRNQPYPKKWVI